MHVNISKAFYTEIYRKNAPQNCGAVFVPSLRSTCTSTCHKPLYTESYRKNAPQNRGADFARACTVEIHQHATRAALYGNLPEKCRAPKPRRRLCASLRSRNPLQHFIYEPRHTEIYRKNAAPQSEHPDQAPAFTLTVRTPQCGHSVWGIIKSMHRNYTKKINASLLILFKVLFRSSR